MLSTNLYNQYVNLLMDNGISAMSHRDDVALDKICSQFINLVNYMKVHGLVLDTLHNGQPGFRFMRNGYSPEHLYIQTEEGA